MNELVNKFKYLVDKADYFQKLKNDENFLFDEILKIPVNDIKLIQKTYENQGKIKKIRHGTCNLLLNNNFDSDTFEELKNKINDEYKTNILKSWKNFSILYIFFFNPIKNNVNEYLNDIGNDLLEKSGEHFKLKTTNFDGAQNFGEVGCWLALYNPKYKSQSEGVQYFINFYHNDTTYGTYKHENKESIDRKEYSLLDINDTLIDKIVSDIKLQTHIIMEEDIRNKDRGLPLNQILYGPPGTGKTYNTINKAIEIIENRIVLDNEDRKELKDTFDKYKRNGQIEFVTFHQSYGYEEFIEGIKAETKDKNISYEVKPGVFKKISKLAIDNYYDSKKSIEIIEKEKTLKEKIDIFLDDVLENEIEFSKTKGGKFKIDDLSENKILIFSEDSNYNENNLELNIDELEKILMSDIDIKTSRQMAKDIFGISNQRQKDTYYLAIYKEFKNYKFKNITIDNIDNKPNLKNYILIIDEINRGNISKIFGELITLIEPSKRIGADEEIMLKLPNSPEPFGVPSNLYIIGTMNTADRSIAPIDTALRRRFIFKEMLPISSLLSTDIDGINLQELLTAMNTRIEYLYDRDHTIGHSYLINVKSLDDLKFAFKNKIIPLLAEYFYEDWENIKLVLNDSENKFIQIKEKGNHPALQSMNKNYDKKLYSINDIDSLEAIDFINIYPQKTEHQFELKESDEPK